MPCPSEESPSTTSNPNYLTCALWSVTGMNLMAGTISGAAGVVAGHPFDTVKVRLQAQPHQGPLLYRSTLHCFTSTIKKEGPLGLFKGVSSPLVGVTAINTLIFGAYGFLLDSLVGGSEASLLHVCLAGGGAGLLNSFISSPVELAKIQMQNQIDQVKYKSPFKCIREFWRVKGTAGVFRGLWPTILRETPSYAVYFGAFEGLQRVWSASNEGQLNNSQLMLAGGISGILAWMSSYPADVIKTRMQALPVDSDSVNKSVTQWTRQIIKEEGIMGLFRGTSATLYRAFPTNAVIFWAYALSMRWFESIRPQDCCS